MMTFILSHTTQPAKYGAALGQSPSAHGRDPAPDKQPRPIAVRRIVHVHPLIVVEPYKRMQIVRT